MNCYEFELNLSNFIDGELKQKEIVKFKTHEKDCDNCCEKLKSMTVMLSILGKINTINAPDNFTRKLHHKISTIESRKSIRTWRILDIFDFGFNPKQSIVFGFSVLLIFSGLFYFSQIDQIPNVNVVDFKKNNPIKPNLSPAQLTTLPQSNYANAKQDSINNSKLNNGKKQISNTSPIQVVNSKK